MADERIDVSGVSLESAEAYVRAAKTALDNVYATSTFGRHKLLSAKNDLGRALECLAESKMSDEEVREAH